MRAAKKKHFCHPETNTTSSAINRTIDFELQSITTSKIVKVYFFILI